MPRDPKRAADGVGGLGYKSFVAWRYLLVANPKVSKTAGGLLLACIGMAIAFGIARAADVGPSAPSIHSAIWAVGLVGLMFTTAVVFLGVLPHSRPAMILGLFGLAVLALALIALKLVGLPNLPLLHLDAMQVEAIKPTIKIVAIFGGVVTGLAMLFGSLRAYFTFFTTVPIGGTWIGTAALVVVLSVMGGFESDLREKILGSNAHIQVSREEGDFTEWHEVRARIDKLPGVVASTPYAMSEVVIAANNTGQNVIIKGIDPASVGKVTDLVNDLEGDHEGMKRLAPIITDDHDLRVPQPAPGAPRTGPTMDPPPADMPTAGEPIDFSLPDPDANGSADDYRVHDHDAQGSGRGPAEPPQPYGGDADKLVPKDEPVTRPSAAPAGRSKGSAAGSAGSATGSAGSGSAGLAAGSAGSAAVLDPPPDDLVTSDEPPVDYSKPDDGQDIVKVIDVPFDAPSVSRRTQSLPGILVGRELVKQTHLYTGQEVRIVSPLSDPANPDATGTPIPFNRDYRVAGTFFTGMYEYDGKHVYVSLESLQQFLDRGDAIDGIEVRVNNPYDTDAFVAQFRAELGPRYRVQDWTELNRSLFSALKLEKIAMFLVLGIVILVASFSIVGNLIMVVVEKAREIALLKTLGASDVGVMQLFAIQGLMIGVIGTLLGVLTGLLVCWLLAQFGFPLNADVYYIDRLPVHVDPASVLAAGSAGILISIAATIYPAVVAARVRPAAGMRH
ncbi:MAG: FtsX-like permease family protein [Kofleriaceae bacterium]